MTFPDGTEGYFSSLRAIYAVYAIEQIGRPIEYLWKQHIDVNHTYHTDKCSITKVNIIKLKQQENVLETNATLSAYFHVTERTIRRYLAKLQSLGIIKHEGPDKGGKWVVPVK